MSLYVPYYRPYNKHNTNIHAPLGIRTHKPSKRAAVVPRLRPRGHWDRHQYCLPKQIPIKYVIFEVVMFVTYTWLLCRTKAVDFSIGRALWWQIYFFLYTFTLVHCWLPFSSNLRCSWLKHCLVRFLNCLIVVCSVANENAGTYFGHYNNRPKWYAQIRTDYIRQMIERQFCLESRCVCWYITQHFCLGIFKSSSFCVHSKTCFLVFVEL
jgi:hypothetical protein